MTPSPPRWLLYGATGYTGRLTAAAAASRGWRPVLAARSEAPLRALAEPLGLEWRTVPLEPAPLRAALEDVEAVLHLAGPFSHTSRIMVDACLAARRHYLDVTGEAEVFAACYARDREARDAGVCLLPGVGFDVVPTDGLAALLKEALPTATRLELAVGGPMHMSPGTAKTVIAGLPLGALERRQGELLRRPLGTRRRRIDFPSGPRLCVGAPLADVVSSYLATGIPNIIIYAAAPAALIALARLVGPLAGLLRGRAVQGLLQGLAGQLASGPDARERAENHFEVWGEVRDDAGRQVTGALTTSEPYAFTVEAALACVARARDLPPGACTPSMALGSGFIRGFPSVRVHPFRVVEGGVGEAQRFRNSP